VTASEVMVCFYASLALTMWVEVVWRDWRLTGPGFIVAVALLVISAMREDREDAAREKPKP
jgi:hypothetical protein